jgi:uncharacterized delta-60 repeat protein
MLKLKTISLPFVLACSILSACTSTEPVKAAITRIIVTANPEVSTAGQKTMLTAMVEGSGKFDPSLQWAITRGSATLSSTTGASVELTPAIAGSSYGVDVEVTSVSNPSVKGLGTFLVRGVPVIAGINLVGSSAPLEPGATVQLSTAITGEGDRAGLEVNWELVSGGGSLAANGLNATYTAPNVADGASVLIRASLKSDPVRFSSVTLAVKALPSGMFDSGFGTNGLVQTSFTGTAGSARAVAVQANGKLVVVGSTQNVATDSDFALARYNTDGSLDLSFDGDGRQTTDFDTNGLNKGTDFANAVAIQSDGKIVVVGGSNNPGVTGTRFGICRYNTNGSLDSGFGSGGKVTVDFAGLYDVATAVVIQSDGKIVVAGRADFVRSGGTVNFALARLNANGSLDTSFGSNGKVNTDFGGYESLEGMVLQSDGKIVVAGGIQAVQEWAPSEAAADFVLARCLSNGSLDTSFGAAGKVRTDAVTGTADFAHSIALDSTGRILVAGRSQYPWDYAVVRYLSDGTSDSSFGSNGRFSPNLRTGHVVNSVLILPNGNVMLVGWGSDGLGLVRLNDKGILINSSISANTVLPGDTQGLSRSIGAVVTGDTYVVVGDAVGGAEFAVARFTR